MKITHNRGRVSLLEGMDKSSQSAKIDRFLKKKSPRATDNKLKIKKEKAPHSKAVKLLNSIFTFVLIFVLLGNLVLILRTGIHGDAAAHAFGSVTKNTLKVVDNVWEPKLKSTDNYTGVLIMGIDSRALNFDGQEFKGKDRDIDTIMQIVFNHETGDVFMFSIPRDTGITITEPCAGQNKFYFRSINHAYKLGEDGGCPEGGVGIMQTYTTHITGFTNHYYAVISYEAFRDIINTVGDEQNGKKGLFIDVPRNVQEYYPREQGGGFEAVYFPKGYQFIDSIKLLKYARSRKASSDFDRAQRQQQVVEALQQKMLSSETLADPIKLFELYNGFKKNALFSELTLDDIRGGLSLLEKLKTGNVYKFVLDDEFGGLNALLTRPIYSGKGTHNRPGYYLSPVHYKDPECVSLKDEYCKVKEYTHQIFDNPDSVSEEATVFAYANTNNTKATNAAFEKGKAKFSLPITSSKFALAAREGWGDVQIYDFSNGQKPKTRKLLKDAFGVEIYPGSSAPFKKPLNGEDFTIVVKTN